MTKKDTDVRYVGMECTVVVRAHPGAPEDWLSRVIQIDFPYRTYDGPFTEKEGLAHLAYNAVANGVEDASRLDGWGDLERGMLTLEVVDVEAMES